MVAAEDAREIDGAWYCNARNIDDSSEQQYFHNTIEDTKYAYEPKIYALERTK